MALFIRSLRESASRQDHSAEAFVSPFTFGSILVAGDWTDNASSNGLGLLQGRSRLLPLRLPRPVHTLSLSLSSRALRHLIPRKNGAWLPQACSTPTPPLQLLVMSCASPSTGPHLHLCWIVSVLQRCGRMQVSSAQIRIQTSCPKACAYWSPFLRTWMPPSVHSNQESISVMKR